MRARRLLFRRLALLFLFVFGATLGGVWLVYRLYPLTYRDLIFERAREYGLDPYLVAAVIRVESRFRPEATSPQGASGLMQIMPETGKWAADQMGLEFRRELLYDPAYNIRIGCWYLGNLLEEFDGALVPALAAYNGGRSNVKRWLSERRWNGEDGSLDQIPFAETRRYVAAVLRDRQRYVWLYGWQQR